MMSGMGSFRHVFMRVPGRRSGAEATVLEPNMTVCKNGIGGTMRLKDIIWPWGRVKRLERALDTAISGLERQSETIILGLTDRLTNIEYGARQRDIAANLRSECIRLHGEVGRLHDAKAKALATHYEFRNSIIEAVNRDMQNGLDGTTTRPRNGYGSPYGDEVGYVYGMPGPIRRVV